MKGRIIDHEVICPWTNDHEGPLAGRPQCHYLYIFHIGLHFPQRRRYIFPGGKGWLPEFWEQSVEKVYWLPLFRYDALNCSWWPVLLQRLFYSLKGIPPYFCWGGGGAVTWRVRWGKPTDLQLVLLSLAVLHPHLQGYRWLILEHIQAASQLSPISGPGFHILGSAGPFNTHSFAFSPAKFCCIYYPLSLSLFFKIILYWSFSAMGLGGEEVERKLHAWEIIFTVFIQNSLIFLFCFYGIIPHSTIYTQAIYLDFSVLHQQNGRNDGIYFILLWRLSKIPYLIVFKKHILSRFLYLWSQNVNTGPSIL